MKAKKKETSKKVEVSEQQQLWIDSISQVLGGLGCDTVLFGAKGNTFIDTKKKQLRKKTKKTS